MDLKLNDIVQRGRLKLSTVQYSLKHPELLPGLPESGAKGRHRVFSVQQAMRLATCTHLVMAGVPLATAGQVVLECERSARSLQRTDRKKPLSYCEPLGRDPWFLRVFDSQYFQVWQRGRSSRFRDVLHFWNVQTEEWELHTDDLPTVRYELDLTALELRLRRSGE